MMNPSNFNPEDLISNLRLRADETTKSSKIMMDATSNSKAIRKTPTASFRRHDIEIITTFKPYHIALINALKKRELFILKLGADHTNIHLRDCKGNTLLAHCDFH